MKRFDDVIQILLFLVWLIMAIVSIVDGNYTNACIFFSLISIHFKK